MKKRSLLLFVGIAMAASHNASAQQQQKKNAGEKKVTPKFSWVNPISDARHKQMGLPEGLRHGTYQSPSMGGDVGYYIYLPPGYEEGKNAETRYPVVYHLHGGRPGGESKSISLSKFVDAATKAGDLPPTIYVFPNGGPMSSYNYPQKDNGSGEDVFVKETIPHIDSSYRTLGQKGRGIQGFSQGGRGTTRIMFKHPELWVSAAPGGSGYEPEKRVQENGGAESENVVFAKGYNTWDLAADYAKRGEERPRFPVRLWVGTKGFNYEFNLKFSDYLNELGIVHDKLVAEGVDHSAVRFYEKRGLELMQWHQANFAKAAMP